MAFQSSSSRSPTSLPFEDDFGFEDERAHLPDVARALFRELRACGYDAADIANIGGELNAFATAVYVRDGSSKR